MSRCTNKTDLMNELWVLKRQDRGLCVICKHCGGASASFCACAKKRYFLSLTDDDLEEYARKTGRIFQKSKDNTEMESYILIVKNGKYYNPAWKHYHREDANVVCDLCGSKNLRTCFGSEDKDLCMDCVAKVSRLL